MEKFKRAGCERCVLVEGGTQVWIDAGLPVNHGERRVILLIRQVQITVGAISGIGSVPALMSATPTSSKNSGNYPVP